MSRHQVRYTRHSQLTDETHACSSNVPTSPAALLLLMLPVLAASNSLVTAVTGVSFYKVFVAGAFLFIAVNYRKITWTRSKTLLCYLAMLVVFFTYGSISMLWAPDRSLSYSKINNIFLALLIAYILYAARAFEAQRFRALVQGWLIAVVTTVMFAAAELVAGRNFFGNARFEDRETYGSIVMSTFHNPNNFSVFLALVMPLLLLGLLQSKDWKKLPLGALWLTSFALLVLSASRIALALAALQLMAVVFLLRGKTVFKLTAIAIGTGIVTAAFVLGTNVAGKIASLVGGGDVSGLSRVTLVLNGLWMFRESNGLGVGAGNFPYYMDNMNPPYSFRELNQPHNLWIEILSEYGIIVFGAFLLFYLYLLRLAWTLTRRAKRHYDRSLNLQSVTLFVLLISYPFAVISPSHYVTDPINWLFLATAVVFCKKIRDAMPVRVGTSRALASSHPSPVSTALAPQAARSTPPAST
jgi:teichuronic acid biosynthesis protein TuaE